MEKSKFKTYCGTIKDSKIINSHSDNFFFFCSFVFFISLSLNVSPLLRNALISMSHISWVASICRSPLIWQHLHTAYSLWAIYYAPRQFPIVGFRPPVRLIDIIARAADTRLHFYLHTFSAWFNPARRLPFIFLFHYIHFCFYFFLFFSFLISNVWI